MEWAEFEASLCPGCKHPRAETMDPEHAGDFEAVPVTCFACAARDAERRTFNNACRDGHVHESAADGLYLVPVNREG